MNFWYDVTDQYPAMKSMKIERHILFQKIRMTPSDGRPSRILRLHTFKDAYAKLSTPFSDEDIIRGLSEPGYWKERTKYHPSRQ